MECLQILSNFLDTSDPDVRQSYPPPFLLTHLGGRQFFYSDRRCKCRARLSDRRTHPRSGTGQAVDALGGADPRLGQGDGDVGRGTVCHRR